MSTLDSFVETSRPQPKPLATSQEIRDRDSIFVANIYRCATVSELRRAVEYLKNVVHGPNPATHEIVAWRWMALKIGRNGLGGPGDFELNVGSDDDGEKYGAGKVLKVMEAEGVIDAVVIVSRWYGGTMLGPVRFTHIETCAREVCRTFKTIEEVEECIMTLSALDETLATLRAELATLSPPTTSESSAKASVVHDYSGLLNPLDLSKAKRLVNARENAVKSMRTLISKKKAG